MIDDAPVLVEDERRPCDACERTGTDPRDGGPCWACSGRGYQTDPERWCSEIEGG